MTLLHKYFLQRRYFVKCVTISCDCIFSRYILYFFIKILLFYTKLVMIKVLHCKKGLHCKANLSYQKEELWTISTV